MSLLDDDGGRSSDFTVNDGEQRKPRGKRGEVIIAAHMSDWYLVWEEKRNGTWFSRWRCTVCNKPTSSQSPQQNDRPVNEYHGETRRK